jgi:hypothetical protein
MTIISHLKRLDSIGSSLVVVASVMLVNGVAHAATTSNTAAAKSSTASATQQQRLQTIIDKGNDEIDRRLNNLNVVLPKITAATHLTASDQTTLTNEVNTEITGLTALKTQLDGETTVTAAVSDVTAMVSEYRVYALVLPKVELVKTADDQQITEAKLITLSEKLQIRLDTERSDNQNASTLLADLTDMTTKTTAAQGISNTIEASVINLQPTDYDSNHAILSGDVAQLKTARADEVSAYDDAQTIVRGIQSL